MSWLAIAALTFAGLEAGLRSFPQLIPEDVLKRYEKQLRTEIAARRFLPNFSQTWSLPRDDGGPPLLVFKPFSPLPWFHEESGRSGTNVMDGLGFCNVGDLSKESKIDVIALGDSLTRCVPHAPGAAWPDQTGRASGRLTYNMARGGYGPYEYLQLLKYFGVAKQPDFVVMQIFAGNDLRDAARYHSYVAATAAEKARFLDRAGWEPFSFELAGWRDTAVGRYSYIYNLLVIGFAFVLS